MKSFKLSQVVLFAFCSSIGLGLFQSAQAVEIAFEQDKNLPLVYLNVAIKAGATTDPDKQAGVTNFMGEMLLRGTKQRTKDLIDLELDQMGAKLEIETRLEALIIRGAVLSSQLDRFMKLVAEIVAQPSFPEDQIRKLKSQVLSEIAVELDNDGRLGNRRFNKFLFRGHPYGKPVIGVSKDIDKLTRAQIQSHYDRLFQARRVLIVGSGDASKEQIENWANQLAQARPDRDHEDFTLQKPTNSEVRRLLIVDKPDRTQTQIYGGQVGTLLTDSDYFPLYLANHAFGGGSFLARLMIEIRVKRGWSYGASSSFQHGTQPRLWSFHLYPAVKDTPAALATTLQLVTDFEAKGITEQEFQQAKDSLVNSSGFRFDTPKKRVENLLFERTLNLPDGFMMSYGPKLEKVTLSEANAAVHKFVKPNQMSITVLGGAKELKEPLAKAAGVAPEKVEVIRYDVE